jgi:hypothetical protein
MQSNTPSTTTHPVQISGNTFTSLHQLVSSLQTGLMQEAGSKKSIIINDVDKSIPVTADEGTLAYVIGSLMSNAIFSTSHCCIHVETIPWEGGWQVRVRNNGVFIYSSMMHSLGHIADAARKLNGIISLQNEGCHAMAVVLSIATRKAA